MHGFKTESQIICRDDLLYCKGHKVQQLKLAMIFDSAKITTSLNYTHEEAKRAKNVPIKLIDL